MKLEPFNVDGRRSRFLHDHAKLVSAFRQVHEHRRRMKSEPAKRQAHTAWSILSRLCSGKQRGVLLADDVGTGKTTIGAWVALLVAGSEVQRGKSNGKVLVLAPNENMARRWREEIETQAKVFRCCAKHLDLDGCTTWGRNQMPGRILVTTHGRSKSSAACDLLIVDEAHRAKGSETQFARKLMRAKSVKRFLFLTATPFSISIRELLTILRRVGAEDVEKPVKKLARRFDLLFAKAPPTNTDSFLKELRGELKAAVKAIQPYVIRSMLSPSERSLYEQREAVESSLEKGEEWPILVQPANDSEVEVLVRMDRLLSLAKEHGLWQKRQTNDPRYHVGWDKLRIDLRTVTDEAARGKRLEDFEAHSGPLKRLLKKLPSAQHPKLASVVEAIRKTVSEGEKVLVFCDHHATAWELTSVLDRKLGSRAELPSAVNKKAWREAWEAALSLGSQDLSPDPNLDGLISRYSPYFLNWLCSRGVSAQTADWLERSWGKIAVADTTSLVALFKKTRARNASKKAADSILEEASRLLESLVSSRSSRAILRAGELPGQLPRVRVAGYCEVDQSKRGNSRNGLFFTGEPDALMMLFNSPFGPDVLITTDRLSEGVDLHGFCRHLIHYEMDPSPLRLVQREGRLWRINSWAARCRKAVRIAYPSFTGTRDERLVKIVRMRRNAFSLLFGGTNRQVDEETDETTVSQQNEILKRLGPSGVPKNPFAP